MRRRLLCLVSVAALALPAAASASVVIRGFDPSAFPRLGVTVVTSVPSPTPPTLFENGRPVTDLTAENLGREKSVVLAIDRSNSMKGRSLADAIEAARVFLDAKQPSDRVAIVTFGSRAQQLTDFSTSAATAEAALQSIRVDGRQGTALYDAVQLSAQALGSEQNHGRVIVLVTDGRDVSSYSTLDHALQAAHAAGVAIYPVGIVGPQFTPDALEQIASRTGGLYRAARSTADLSQIYRSIADELRRTWRLEYLTAARPGDRLELKTVVAGFGSDVDRVVVPSGVQGTGNGTFLPDYVFTQRGTEVLGLVVGLLVLLGAALFLATFREGWLRAMLAPHVGLRKLQLRRRTRRERLAALSALFRATEHLFSHTRYWARITKLIERSDLPIKTVELVWATPAAAVLTALVFSAFGAKGIVVFLGLLVGGFLPGGFVMYKARRRQNAFENQLPDMLVAIAASLKAGHGFKSALQALVDEGVEPASKELKRVLTETRLGRPMEDALADMTTRVRSKNFDFIVTAVNIQTQVGGSLAGLFDMVADTVRQRHQFARKIRSLTAMGRMSAYVLTGLPVLVALALTALNPSYMAPLWHSHTGNVLLVAAVIMIFVGSLFLRKIVSFRG
jgi:tight adherence protein B